MPEIPLLRSNEQMGGFGEVPAPPEWRRWVGSAQKFTFETIRLSPSTTTVAPLGNAHSSSSGACPVTR